MRKNVANQTVAAQMVSATDGSAITTGTTSVVVTIDAGTQTSVGNATHEGNGTWTIDTGTAANTNGNHVVWTFTNSSAVSVAVQTWPVAHAGNGYPQVDTISIGNTTQTARDIGASVLLSSGTGTGQIQLSGGNVTQVTNVGNATLGNVAHGGTGSTLTLQQVTVSNASDHAVLIENTGGLLKNGLRITSTSAGGLQVNGASDANAVTFSVSGGAGHCLSLNNSGTGKSLEAIGGARFNNGVEITGNLTAGNATVSGTTALGVITGTSLTLTGNLTAGNITTGGTFSAGTNGLPWPAGWDAEVQSECNDALVALGLDHLISASVTGTDIVDDSIVAQLVSATATADWDDFDNTTESLQALRDRGDAAWTTGAGGTPPQLLQSTTIATLASQTSFTLTAGSADDDAYNNAIAVITDQSTATQKAVGTVSDYTGSTKTVTLAADPAIFTMAVGDTIEIIAALGSAGSAPTAAAIADAVWDEATSGHATAGTTGKALSDVLVDTAEIGAAGAGLTDLGGMSTTMRAQVNAEADAALTDYDPPTNAEMVARTLAAADYFDPAADTVASVTTVTNSGNATLGNNAHQGTSLAISGNITAGNATVSGTSALGIVTATSITASGNITASNFAGTHVGDTTGNLSGSVASVTNRVTANTDQIAGNATSATNLGASTLGIVSSSVNDASATTTSFVTALTEATDDHYNGRVIVFTSGAVANQATDITDYNGTTKTVTVTALTEAPANGVTFVIV